MSYKVAAQIFIPLAVAMLVFFAISGSSRADERTAARVGQQSAMPVLLRR